MDSRIMQAAVDTNSRLILVNAVTYWTNDWSRLPRLHLMQFDLAWHHGAKCQCFRSMHRRPYTAGQGTQGTPGHRVEDTQIRRLGRRATPCKTALRLPTPN